jgi:D-alanyl-D-alanine carboxypeptidase/D-alanyl-D-alanine-endopeptidase (penicillin-binding protein 4)
LIDALPTSGRTGTLRRRTMGVAAGRIVAKTGTLSGASALSGFIRDKAGRERWVFAAIGNRENSPNGLLSTRQDELMKILVRTLDEGGWKPSDPASVKPPLKRYKPGTKVRVDGAGS